MDKYIHIKGARLNNLKNVDVQIPLHKFTVITGLSGSGKSSLALDTIYSEGLRRYIECLSTYARQFLDRVDKPDVDEITGLPPSIAVESRNSIKNSRSTVGTITEIYDYLRLLYSKVAKLICPNCNIEIIKNTPHTIAEYIIKEYRDNTLIITVNLNKDYLSNSDIPLSRGFTKIFTQNTIKDIEELNKLSNTDELIIDRLVINSRIKDRIIESIESAFEEDKHRINLRCNNVTLTYSKDLQCPKCTKKFREPATQLFSFNSPAGACSECNGFGNILDIDPDLVVPDPNKSLYEGAIEPFTKPSMEHAFNKLIYFAKKNQINTNIPFRNIPKKDKDLIFYGNNEFRGIKGYFKHLEEKSYKLHIRVFLSKYRSGYTCSKCNGSRLIEDSLWYKINNKNIHQFSLLPISQSILFFKNIKFSEYESKVAKELLKQIELRLSFLMKVGLGYLTLSRLARTLSGGEAQRVSLACQLGSSLTETLYILDEPSIGLHQRDIDKLTSILMELTGRDNTVVLVEHDIDMIKSSDYIVELGPKSGEQGGDIIYQGATNKFLSNSVNSITKSYLSNQKSISIPSKRRIVSKNYLIVEGAEENNLKNVTVKVPLNSFICITGVSGSGKSSLVTDVLYSSLARKFNSEVEKVGKYKSIQGIEHISNVYLLDQKPIGKSSRSNPATYLKIYDDIRKLFSETWGSRSKRFTASHFSFNVPDGRCSKCEGEGNEKVEMLFLADIYITCDECKGKKFKNEVLNVRYKDKNIDDVLNMTVDDSISFFRGSPKLIQKLKILSDVGLGYLKLGQSSATLSGGEAQRIKIAKELSKKNDKNILYILDEPSVGLHIDDINKLLKVLNKLVDSGNTVLVIEHNMEIIKCSDYIIDLGPEGGEEGGYIVAEGTPEEIADVKKSYTGMYLKKYLN